MLCGQRKAVIDDKWRLLLPGEYASELGGNHVSGRILFVQGRGYVNIYPSIKNHNNRWAPCEVVIANLTNKKEKKGKMGKKKKYEYPRITIPPMFRETRSFRRGHRHTRKVTIAGMGDHLEIWPR